MESARLLGYKVGLSSQEMNYVLNKEGLLDGTPGHYKLTEKGQEFGQYSVHDNGYGGYAYRGWAYPVWDADKVLSLLDITPEKAELYRQEFRDSKIKTVPKTETIENNTSSVNDLPALEDNLSDSGLSMPGLIILGVAGLIGTIVSAIWDGIVKEDGDNE